MPAADPPRGRDPFAFELFRGAVFAIADEMAVTICRTTYSGVLRDNMDFSTALADAGGRLVAQGIGACTGMPAPSEGHAYWARLRQGRGGAPGSAPEAGAMRLSSPAPP